MTLDFIPYDRILFRMVSGITKAVEDEIYKSRYARLNTPSDGITFPLFNDTEDIKASMITIGPNMLFSFKTD